jgi:hypothetical protein
MQLAAIDESAAFLCSMRDPADLSGRGTMHRAAITILLTLALLGGQARARTVVTDTSIEILQPIQFVGTTSVIAPISTRMLDVIASTLTGNPSILLMEVRADGADAPFDQWMVGELRARAIVAPLVKRGVAPWRLRAAGIARPDPGSGRGPWLFILKRAS